MSAPAPINQVIPLDTFRLNAVNQIKTALAKNGLTNADHIFTAINVVNASAQSYVDSKQRSGSNPNFSRTLPISTQTQKGFLQVVQTRLFDLNLPEDGEAIQYTKVACNVLRSMESLIK